MSGAEGAELEEDGGLKWQSWRRSSKGVEEREQA
jgi:hypothetical protein